MTISAIVHWRYYTEQRRQDCNCVSGKTLPLCGSKTEQTIERIHLGALLVAEMLKAVYLLNIYFTYTEIIYLYLTADDVPSHQNAICMGAVMYFALICHLSFNLHNTYKASNNTGNINSLSTYTYCFSC